VIGVFVLLLCSVLCADAVSARPNVLLIVTDDQREDTIGALGNPHIETPHLDELVRGGTVFRNAYCMGGFSAAVCTPSRMMLLRGRSWFRVRELPEGFASLPKVMASAGYETFFLGKLGNGDEVVQAQFMHAAHVTPRSEDSSDGRDVDTRVRAEGIPGARLAEGALAMLAGRDRSRPFFMCLAGPEPHDPRVAPQAYLDRYPLDRMPLPGNFLPFHPFDHGDLLVRDERLAAWPRTSEEIRGHLRDYYAVITHLDEQLGRIFAALRASGDYENTIVVFTTDQGLAIGSHGLMGKQNLYEHSMGVPLIFAGPGIGGGKVVEEFVYLFDLLPTFCDFAGVAAPEGIEGRSLVPLLRGAGGWPRDAVFLAYRDVQRAVRVGAWKLICYPKIGRMQLFDLASDPEERHDRAREAAQSARIEALLARLRVEQARYGDDLVLGRLEGGGGEVGLDYFIAHGE
jgi:arylsulfatase A-like enzyme